MNNEVKTLDGMDDKIKSAAKGAYKRFREQLAKELPSKRMFRVEIHNSFLTTREFNRCMRILTNRERINYVFDMAIRVEDSDACFASLTKFCEDIGLTYDEGYNIYFDVELKGY